MKTTLSTRGSIVWVFKNRRNGQMPHTMLSEKRVRYSISQNLDRRLHDINTAGVYNLRKTI